MRFEYWSRPEPCQACYVPTRSKSWLLGGDNPPICDECWSKYRDRPGPHDPHDPYKEGYAWWKKHCGEMLQSEEVLTRKALLMLEGRTSWPAKHEEKYGEETQ